MTPRRVLALWPVLWGLVAGAAHADGHHTLWTVRGAHSTVYILGSIHVLRDSDYPLPPVVESAYAHVKSLVMEIDMDDLDMEGLQQEMLSAATLPEGQTLSGILGAARYGRAQKLVTAIGLDLGMFESFAPWFAAESISQLQLMQLGFGPDAGIEMHFVELARNDHKAIAGLETAAEQMAVFRDMPMPRQADYLMASLDEAKDLPDEVAAMVSAWKVGNTAWFDEHLNGELGRDPALFESVLAARNRKWIPRLLALLGGSEDTLVIVGAGHLVGRGSIIDLLRRRGFSPVQD
jgi:uncharacterized protein